MSMEDWARAVITAIVTIGFGAVLIAFMYFPSKPDQANIISGMIGVLGSGYLLVLNYYFKR